MKKLLILKESVGGVTSADDIFNKIKKINIDYKQENFLIFYLNTKNKIIKVDNLFKGGVDSVLTCPITIFRNALINNSNKLILAHNHPSEDLTPSTDDVEIFKILVKGAEVLGLKILDSVIFNKKEFYCMERLK